jgi:hypothetical protein
MKRTLAVIGLSVLSMAAQANFDAAASISGLTFELTDLDPNDGISPAIDFSSSNWSGSSYIFFENMSESRSVGFSGALRNVGRTLPSGPFTTGVEVQGSNFSLLSTGSVLHSDQVAVSFSQGSQAYSNTNWSVVLRVTPKTQLKVSANAHFAVSSSLAIAPDTINQVSASSTMLWFVDGGSKTDQLFYVDQHAPGTFSETGDKTLSLTDSNDSTGYKTSSFFVSALARQDVAPVPEPATWGLMTFGLLALSMRNVNSRHRSQDL